MGIDYNNVIVTDGLVLYIDAANPRSYSGAGLTANGLIGGIGGTLVNGVGFTSSNNGSFIFDGTNDYIYAPINTNLFSTQATMIMWLKNDIATPPQAQTGIMGYFGAGGGIDHYPWPDGAAYLSTFRNSRIGPITLSASISRDSVHMLSVTTDAVNWKLYQNTTLVTTQAALSSVYLGSYFIGKSNDDFFYQGKIYSFMIYNRALSDSEILQNYNAMKARYR